MRLQELDMFKTLEMVCGSQTLKEQEDYSFTKRTKTVKNFWFIIFFLSFLAGILFGAVPLHTVLTPMGISIFSSSQSRGFWDLKINENSEEKVAIKRMQQRRDLPPLPDSSAPWNSQWSNSIAICAIMRDENITDVQEWLEYYK
jgi:hypothetical protein